MQCDSMPGSKPMMTIQESVKVCLRKYADFGGRATRAEFWWWALATVIAGLVLGAVDSSINVLAGGYAYSPFSTIFYLAILLPNLAVTARRLHDIGKTGWWQLVWLLLGVGAWLIFLVVVIFSLANYLMGEGWNVGEEEFRATLTFAGFAPAIFGLTFALLVTLAVVIWGIVWMTRQGEAGPSRYGPDPRTPEETHPAGGVPT